MAFRLMAIKRLLYGEVVSWRPLTNTLLRQTGGLDSDRELFLMDLKQVDRARLPAFHQSLLNAWQALGVQWLEISDDARKFVHEPLFQNSIFAGISTSRSFIEYFTNSRINRAQDLMEPSLKQWLPSGSVSKKMDCIKLE